MLGRKLTHDIGLEDIEEVSHVKDTWELNSSWLEVLNHRLVKPYGCLYYGWNILDYWWSKSMLLEVEVNYLAIDGSQAIWRREVQSNYCKMSLKVKREKEIKILQHQTAGKSQWSVKWLYRLVKIQLLVCHRKYFISSFILDTVPQQLHVWLRAPRVHLPGEGPHETAIAMKFRGILIS